MSNEQSGFDMSSIPDVPFGPNEEQVEALQAEMLGEKPVTEEATDEEVVAEEQPDTSEESFLDIDGERIPIEQAKEWLNKGKDATKKWQEASEMKKSAESLMEQYTWVQDMQSAWSSGPEGQRQVVEILAKEAGFDLANPTTPNSTKLEDYGLSDEDLSNEGRALLGIIKNLETKNQHLLSQNTALNKTLSKFEQYVEDQKTTDVTSQIANQLKNDFGADVTAAQLRQLVKDTGVNDPYAAWLKVNAKNLTKTKTPKPNSPGGHGKTFNPNDYTADQTVRMLIKGFVPVE